MLDTLLNSTKDVAAPDAIWHPETFRHQLEKLITTDSAHSQVSHCLLGDQLTTILDEGATVLDFHRYTVYWTTAIWISQS